MSRSTTGASEQPGRRVSEEGTRALADEAAQAVREHELDRCVPARPAGAAAERPRSAAAVYGVARCATYNRSPERLTRHRRVLCAPRARALPGASC
jgi:hypothetical protein